MKRIVRNFLILFLCVCAIVPISVSKSPERIEASELKDAASIGKVHPDDIVYVGMNYNSGRESCWMKLKWKRIPGALGYEVKAVSAKGRVFDSGTTSNTKIRLDYLPCGITFRLKVRAYKRISSGQIIYGKWSTSSRRFMTYV